ncbi:hypothetical protein BMS3Abin07_00636 [bacterium BMS3Abin07]|nr:hypothetical protein BMS3Abin07_00636 [bacterium BMS3Abin07]GBE32805.1 hypothetical protein BMS3Bbin05_01728 [bacterium BMS3Bbin05]HDL20918.1 hypothetical protein [Nitrospirota bacterium]
MKKYLLKEYGSWSIMAIAFMTGLLVSKGAGVDAAWAFVALALLVNSKQAFTLWMRRVNGSGALLIFLAQALVSATIFILLFGKGILDLLPLIIIPIMYIALLVFKGEHFILTEISGFAVLSLSAVISKFSVTANVDYILYLCVAVYFIAGVFKVRVRFKRSTFMRAVMIVYVFFSFAACYLMKVPVIVLLPLADNLVFSITMYKVKLMVTGWVEVTKGVLFLLLMMFFYG